MIYFYNARKLWIIFTVRMTITSLYIIWHMRLVR